MSVTVTNAVGGGIGGFTITVPSTNAPHTVFVFIFSATDIAVGSVYINGVGTFTLLGHARSGNNYTGDIEYYLYKLDNVPAGTHVVSTSGTSGAAKSLGVVVNGTPGFNSNSSSQISYYSTVGGVITQTPALDGGALYIDFICLNGASATFSVQSGQTIAAQGTTGSSDWTARGAICYKANIGGGVYSDSYNLDNHKKYWKGYEMYSAGAVFSIPPMPIG